ncbi:protein INVOLVED IN DE NOVO 2-like [Dioscorea cayenensis subsp. rotundata]|uniref:Protein INVOLVED IN DE NOVO 2-like n=1 Tax=Dioscorea cayennensis subsp. rotundata TaxID=55577 RepID=A0AB40CEX2_DIOCR|nr:protein INVOLVED IN DE NOVO 2-like [Dioscorea cayenensis subsp. rotundata]
MDYSSEESSDLSDSEVDEYEARSYLNMKTGNTKVKRSSGIYRCPFCVGKKKLVYSYKDLLQHAIGVGSSNRSGKVKANHRAMAKYMKTDLSEAVPLIPHLVNEEKPPLPIPKQDNQFVWPWNGIIVNIPTEWKDGQLVGDSASRLKESLSRFNPVRVVTLWDAKGHTGTAIVDFGRDWAGFKDAMAFEGHLESQNLGKKDWCEAGTKSSNIYGWVARADDYVAIDPIGKHLHKKGELKTVVDLAEEESRKMEKLVAYMKDQLEAKSRQLKELELKYQEVDTCCQKMVDKLYLTHQAYNEEIQLNQWLAQENSIQSSDSNVNKKVALPASPAQYQAE